MDSVLRSRVNSGSMDSCLNSLKGLPDSKMTRKPQLGTANSRDRTSMDSWYSMCKVLLASEDMLKPQSLSTTADEYLSLLSKGKDDGRTPKDAAAPLGSPATNDDQINDHIPYYGRKATLETFEFDRDGYKRDLIVPDEVRFVC